MQIANGKVSQLQLNISQQHLQGTASGMHGVDQLHWQQGNTPSRRAMNSAYHQAHAVPTRTLPFKRVVSIGYQDLPLTSPADRALR